MRIDHLNLRLAAGRVGMQATDEVTKVDRRTLVCLVRPSGFAVAAFLLIVSVMLLEKGVCKG